MSECRRKTFARFFGDEEHVSFQACKTMCDNCLRNNNRNREEVPSKNPCVKGGIRFQSANQLYKEDDGAEKKAKKRPIALVSSNAEYSSLDHHSEVENIGDSIGGASIDSGGIKARKGIGGKLQFMKASELKKCI